MLTWTEFTCWKIRERFSAYNFAILPVFSLNAWGTFNTSVSEAGATRQHQTSSAQVLSQVHAKHALKSHCSERMWFREACAPQVEGHHQHVGQVSPTAASDVCLQQADPMQSLPSSPSHSCTLRFWACFPLEEAAPRSTLCSRCQGQVPASSPANTFLALSFPLNAHWTSFPTCQTCPVCIHLSRTNDLKWRCSLAVTITLTIYSAEANDESRAAFQKWKNF